MWIYLFIVCISGCDSKGSKITTKPSKKVEKAKKIDKTAPKVQKVAKAPVKTTVKKQKKTLPTFDGYQILPFSYLARFDLPAQATVNDFDKIPGYVQNLSDSKVLVPGFIIPLKIRQRQVIQFLLVAHQDDCCFGGSPKLTEFMQVDMPSGEGVPFARGIPVVVFGRFKIEKYEDEGELMQIYRCFADKVMTPLDDEFDTVMEKIPQVSYGYK